MRRREFPWLLRREAYLTKDLLDMQLDRCEGAHRIHSRSILLRREPGFREEKSICLRRQLGGMHAHQVSVYVWRQVRPERRHTL